MRWLMKSLVSLILIVILFIIIIYAFIQTQWGAQKTSEWLTQYTDYDIRFSGIEHDLMQPEQVIVHDLLINPKQDKAIVSAKSAQIRLNWQFFTTPSHLQKITLENGNIDFTNKTPSIPLSADILQFKNMALRSEKADFSFDAKKITGGITPWLPTSTDLIGAGHFQFSIASGMINNNEFSNFIISGQYQPNNIQIEKLGTRLLNGSLSLSGQYQDNQWKFDEVYMNGLRWQSSQTFDELIQSLSEYPRVSIKTLNIVDLTAEGKQWAISGFDGQFAQLNWDNALSFTTGELNTDDIVFQNEHVTDLIAKLNQQNNQLNLDNLSLRYEKGLIKLAGHWNKDNKTITIQDATLSGFLYTLPENWLTFLAQPIDNKSNIQNITIEQLSINQSILIDITPEFPFQFTNLTGKLQNLMVAKEGEWGLWQGSAVLNADSGTLNRIELRRPDLNIVTQHDNAIVEQYSAFIGNGIVRGSAALVQSNQQRQFSLIANGLNVPLSTLYTLGLKTTYSDEIGQFTLKLKGDLRSKPVISTLNGTLTGNKGEQQILNAVIQNGEIINHL
ncbi:AsmA family protein [Proteus vulgaris]|uniref:AsmA family protein n=4 Tax=Enterobacterales TaxID=91347 RepID=UPI0021B105A8|nr:AsmA family protein [Proteus vulgaris]MCT6518661.1 AsmA family protein [Proteus vulgaris]WOO49617.1 AsmA family protein [Hafnia alvei]WPF04081.1 AsmA family protein [Proteus vulgaris]